MTSEPAFDAELDRLFGETARALFEREAGVDALRGLPPGGIAEPLWRKVRDLGFPGLGVAESAGGAGGSVAYLCTVARAAGRHAALIPLVPDAVASWLLVEAGLEQPGSLAAPALAATRRNGTVEAHGVPYARYADRVAVVLQDTISVVPPDALTVTPGVNLAGEPHDTVSFEAADVAWFPLARAVLHRARERAALVRSASIVGALEAVERLVVTHVRGRQQFGAPLARLPVVRERLALVTEAVALSTAALELARLEAAKGNGTLSVPAAKIVVSRSSGVVSRIAHQLHGAIGVTGEHPLHHFTRRLVAWRDQDGTGAEWARSLGAAAVAAGPAEYWPGITGDPMRRQAVE